MQPVDRAVLWSPNPERVSGAQITHFANLARTRFGVEDADLHRWSVESPEHFWALVWEFCGVRGERGERVYVAPTSANEPSTARFFPDARLSVVENLLARTGTDEALVAIDELGARRARTWDELSTRVAALAGALLASGVRSGDRVVAWLPNSLEVVEAMLAAASIGAVFSSASPDFGASGVIDRFGQIEPVVLFAIDGYRYNGNDFDCLERLAEIRACLTTITTTVLVRATKSSSAPNDVIDYEEFLARGAKTPARPQRFAFDHPWYVLFSSGTTGVPKCIVHRTGGVLVQHMKEHRLHCDMREGDRILYFTTTGWMMWNWLVSVLASGATTVLYDGSPTFPKVLSLFEVVDRERVTLLGVSAKLIDLYRKLRQSPNSKSDLFSLRMICSTGSPLSPEGFEWVYTSVKHDVHLASISGGTDLCGCFVGGDPRTSVRSGEIQGPMLGMDVDVIDEATMTLFGSPDVSGELVCRSPFPSMPLGFWGDGKPGCPDPTSPGPKYLAAYFERFDGMWAQGDFASWTSAHGVIIHGRSDTTLNPGGVRIGTAEIYRVVEQLPQVVESCVFGQNWENDVRIVLLVRLASGIELTDALVADIKQRIRVACTPRHVPALVVAVDDLPRTRSNKLVELALADAVNGRPVRNAEALANPECIERIVANPLLRRSG